MKKESSAGCGCVALVLLLNITVGAISAHYVILTWLSKDIAWGWAALIGLVGGELTIPAALITWLLIQAGVI